MPCACGYAYRQPCRLGPCKESRTTPVFNWVEGSRPRFEYGIDKGESLLPVRGKFNVSRTLVLRV